MATMFPVNRPYSSPPERRSVYDGQEFYETEEAFESLRTSAFSDARIRAASRWSKEGRPYEFAIQMPAWKKNSGSTEELFAEKLNLELVEIFGTGVKPMPHGRMDVKHGYFKIAASKEKLEEWAEEDGVRIRVKPWIGGGFKAFTKKRKLEGQFSHPQCKCETMDDCTYCCATAKQDFNDHPERCSCLMLLPYQQQVLVRSRIERAFDNYFRDRAREQAREKNQKIIVTTDDVRRFIIKFGDNNGLAPSDVDGLVQIFFDVEGDEFQRLPKAEMARLVTPGFGVQMTDMLFHAVQAETADDIIVPSGQGVTMALKEKVITQIYPLHTLQKHHQRADDDFYPTRREILTQYCSWMNSIGTCMIFGKQSEDFLDFIRDYLGEKIALYFAFLHYYTTWLVPLALFGTPLVFSQWVSASFDSAGIIGYCTLVAVWSTIMLEFWQRRNAQLAWKWDMANFEGREEELDTHDRVNVSNLGFYEKEGAWVDMGSYLKHARDRGKQHVQQFIRFQHRDKVSPLPNCWCCVPGDEDARQEFGSWFWRFCKEMMSWSVVTALMVAVCFMTLGLLYFRLVLQDVNEVFGGLVAGSINAVMITVLDYVFEGIAVQLTNFESHRTATRYEDQLIAKQFTFQFINSYFSLFYIAFFKGGRVFRETDDPKLFGRSDKCKDVEGNDTDSCMAELAYQLTAMFVTRMLIGNLMEYWAPHAQYKANMWKLWYGTKKKVKEEHPGWSNKEVIEEMRKRQNSRHFSVDRAGGESRIESYFQRKHDEYRKQHPAWSEEKVVQRVEEHLSQHQGDKYDAAEKQAYQAPYNLGTNVSGTFYDYAELAIQFGYVVIFAPAFPLAPLVAIISNVIEHRQDAYKILVSCQRPSYKGAQDMGTWLAIFQLISYVAVITNFLIIAFTSDQLNNILEDPSTALKLAVVVIAEHLVFASKALIIHAIPREPYNVRVAKALANEIQRAETEYRDYIEWVDKKNTMDRHVSSFQQKQAYKQSLRDHAHALLYEHVEYDEFDVEDVDPLASPQDVERGIGVDEPMVEDAFAESEMTALDMARRRQQQQQQQHHYDDVHAARQSSVDLPGLAPDAKDNSAGDPDGYRFDASAADDVKHDDHVDRSSHHSDRSGSDDNNDDDGHDADEYVAR